MERLKFPIIRKPIILEPKTLSMDEYLRFVNFNITYTLNIKAYRQWKRMLAVNVPFRLK